jgi:hypothetical protein
MVWAAAAPPKIRPEIAITASSFFIAIPLGYAARGVRSVAHYTSGVYMVQAGG